METPYEWNRRAWDDRTRRRLRHTRTVRASVDNLAEFPDAAFDCVPQPARKKRRQRRDKTEAAL